MYAAQCCPTNENIVNGGSGSPSDIGGCRRKLIDPKMYVFTMLSRRGTIVTLEMLLIDHMSSSAVRTS